jgi:putative peptidoglycan lipid II flippase
MSLARDVTTVGGATLVSRLLGFGRDVGIAALLGAGATADAFFAVLQVVNFFRRLLAEGALNAAFVPLWLRIKAGRGGEGVWRFFRETLASMVICASALSLAGFVFAATIMTMLAPGFDGERHALAATYLREAAPYVALAGTVAILAAALNAEGRVTAVAIGTIAFNAALLVVVASAAAIGGASPSQIGATFALGIALAGLVQLIVTGIGFSRLRPRLLPLRFGLSVAARLFFNRAVPGLIAAGIPQLKLIAGAMIASSSPAAVSWLYYANRLYELPLGVVSIAIASVLVPAIATSVRSGGEHAIADAQSRGFEIALGLAVPAAIAFAVLAAPIAGALFERGAFGPSDTAAVAAALTAICAGLPGHALEKVLGAVSFAHEDTRTPMLAALCGLAAAVAGALVLFPGHGAEGVAAAIAISGWVGATLLALILWRRRWLNLDRAAIRRLPRMLLAAALMGAVVLALHHAFALLMAGFASQVVRIATLAVLVVAGLATYVATLALFGVARPHDLLFRNQRSEVRDKSKADQDSDD